MYKLLQNLSYTHVRKFITIKKNHRNKKNIHSPVYPFLKINNHKKEPYK